MAWFFSQFRFMNFGLHKSPSKNLKSKKIHEAVLMVGGRIIGSLIVTLILNLCSVSIKVKTGSSGILEIFLKQRSCHKFYVPWISNQTLLKKWLALRVHSINTSVYLFFYFILKSYEKEQKVIKEIPVLLFDVVQFMWHSWMLNHFSKIVWCFVTL